MRIDVAPGANEAARPSADAVDDGSSTEAAIIDDWFAEAVPALSNAIVSAISFIDFSAVLIDGYQRAGAGKLTQLIVAKGQGHNFWPGFFRCRPLAAVRAE